MGATSFQKYTEQVTPKRETICGLLEDMGGRRSISGGLGRLSHQSIDNANQSALLNGLGWNPEDLHCAYKNFSASFRPFYYFCFGLFRFVSFSLLFFFFEY